MQIVKIIIGCLCSIILGHSNIYGMMQSSQVDNFHFISQQYYLEREGAIRVHRLEIKKLRKIIDCIIAQQRDRGMLPEDFAITFDIDYTLMRDFITDYSGNNRVTVNELRSYVYDYCIRHDYEEKQALSMANAIKSGISCEYELTEPEAENDLGTIGVIKELYAMGIRVLCATARPSYTSFKTMSCFERLGIPIPIKNIIFCGSYIDKGTCLAEYFCTHVLERRPRMVFLVDDRESILQAAEVGFARRLNEIKIAKNIVSDMQFIPVLYRPEETGVTDTAIIENMLQERCTFHWSMMNF